MRENYRSIPHHFIRFSRNKRPKIVGTKLSLIEQLHKDWRANSFWHASPNPDKWGKTRKTLHVRNGFLLPTWACIIHKCVPEIVHLGVAFLSKFSHDFLREENFPASLCEKEGSVNVAFCNLHWLVRREMFTVE